MRSCWLQNSLTELAIFQHFSVFVERNYVIVTPLFFSLCLQSQHFNYTWMRHIRQQDLCVAHQGESFALQSCDNSKPELRWFHKSSNSALVG